jgi:hypothetical protein
MLFVVPSAGESPNRPSDLLYRGFLGFDFRNCRIGGNEDLSFVFTAATGAPSLFISAVRPGSG